MNRGAEGKFSGFEAFGVKRTGKKWGDTITMCTIRPALEKERRE